MSRGTARSIYAGSRVVESRTTPREAAQRALPAFDPTVPPEVRDTTTDEIEQKLIRGRAMLRDLDAAQPVPAEWVARFVDLHLARFRHLCEIDRGSVKELLLAEQIDLGDAWPVRWARVGVLAAREVGDTGIGVSAHCRFEEIGFNRAHEVGADDVRRDPSTAAAGHDRIVKATEEWIRVACQEHYGRNRGVTIRSVE